LLFRGGSGRKTARPLKKIQKNPEKMRKGAKKTGVRPSNSYRTIKKTERLFL
jgi:hypothetical protein